MDEDVLIATGETLVACDGRKLLVLSNEGTRELPSFTVRSEFHRPDGPSRDLGTDRPGRMDAYRGGPRSALDQPDPHDAGEAEFMRGVAELLDEAVTSGRLQSLVVAAPPRALGQLRHHDTPARREAVRAEIASDFVRMPVPEIESHFKRLAAG